MKRYLLFHGESYYPCGGMRDFKEESDDLYDLIGFTEKLEASEWAHIYDTHDKKILLQTEDTGRQDHKYIWKKYVD